MKYLIASDIHGSLDWTNKLLKVFDSGEYDKLILLGDIYYHGPRNPFPDGYNPKAVSEALNNIKDNLLVIKGNCDAEVDQMISEFRFEDTFELEVAGKKIFLSHGQNYNIDNFSNLDFDVMFYGHFHTGFIKEHEGKIFVNPGSISLPKNGTKNSYVVLEESGVCLFDFNGNKIEEIKF